VFLVYFPSFKINYKNLIGFNQHFIWFIESIDTRVKIVIDNISCSSNTNGRKAQQEKIKMAHAKLAEMLDKQISEVETKVSSETEKVKEMMGLIEKAKKEPKAKKADKKDAPKAKKEEPKEEKEAPKADTKK
jgi:hypothetical protein